MKLWLQTHLLLAALLLCRSAPTQDECEALLQPVDLTDTAMFNGRLNTISSFTEGLFVQILSAMESSWMDTTAETSDGAKTLKMSEVNKINGNCFAANSTMKVVGDKVMAEYANITSTFFILPSSEDVKVFSSNSTFSGSIDGLLQFLNFNTTGSPPEGAVRSLYLMSQNTTVKDSDLEQFKKQARCLGFQGEPVFQYDPKDGFCSDEGTFHLEF